MLSVTPGYVNASAIACAQYSGQAFVDSGTICVTTPSDVAEAYSKLLHPPAFMPTELGFYVPECDARGPSEPLQVVIEGKTFSIPGSSFVLGGVLLSKNGLVGAYGNYGFSGLQGQIFSPTRCVPDVWSFDMFLEVEMVKFCANQWLYLHFGSAISGKRCCSSRRWSEGDALRAEEVLRLFRSLRLLVAQVSSTFAYRDCSTSELEVV